METRAEHQELIDDRSRSGEQPRTPSPETPSVTSSRWHGYHPCGTMEEEQRPDRLPSQAFGMENMEQASLDGQATLQDEQAPLDARLQWQPRYLRRSVIATFIFIFVILIAAIETLVVVSAKNDGIATSRSELHYLWTYGPTAFLTLVAAFWSRVEYQSKLVAPWRRLMQPHPVDAKRTLLLDYISDPQPVAIVKAFRNRDWTVSITCTVSILIKALIVISTGLITLSWIPVHRNSYPMILQDTFSNDSARRLSETKTTSFLFMLGLISQNLSYLGGLSKDYAFQSATASLPDSAETQVTVDGLTNGLDCVPVDLGILGTSFPAPTPGPRGSATLYDNFTVTITSSGCNIKAQPIRSPIWIDCDLPVSRGFIARFAKVQCDNTEDVKGRRVLVMFGNMSRGVHYSRNMTNVTGNAVDCDARRRPVAILHRSTQMLCVPTYTIRRVDIIRNSTHPPRVIPVVGSLERRLGSIHPWAIMDAQFNAVSAWYDTNSYSEGRQGKDVDNIGTARLDADQYIGLAMDSQLGLDIPASPTDLFDLDFLKHLTEAYYRQHAAIISKQVLMEPASIETKGSAIVMANRLVIRNWAQLMVGLITTCLILFITTLFTVSNQSIPRDPSCIPDLAALVFHSHDLQTRLRDLGATHGKELIRGLARCSFQLGLVKNTATEQTKVIILDQQQRHGNTPQDFTQAGLRCNPHPRMLHPGLRLTLCSVLIALIIGLDLLLQMSNREDGLRDVVDGKYIHYLWTTTPALILGTLTIVVSSMDFQIRSLAPYMMLKRKTTSERILKLDHLDMSILHTMYREFKLGNVGALAISITMLIASTFTLFSGSLFQALAASSKAMVILRANQSFLLDATFSSEFELNVIPPGAIASLVLGSNLSYPGFTNDNLAFPELLIGKTTSPNPTFNSTSVSIETTIPAIRGKVNCRLYNSSQHHLDFNTTSNSKDKGEVSNDLRVTIEGEYCRRSDMWCRHSNYNSLFHILPNTTYVGRAQEMNSYSRSCSDLLYTWGKVSYSSQPIVQHIASAGCNVSLEGLDVDVAFLGTNLHIDTSPQNAPRPREDTVYNVPMERSREQSQKDPDPDYQELIAIQAGQDLDPFFGLLVSSRFAIPVSDLGDEAANAKVVDAIRAQHGIIQAQNLANNRVNTSYPNATTLSTNSSSKIGHDEDGFTLYNATATDTSGQRRRVKQDAASTRALQGLLGASLVLLTISWLFTYRDTNVLPRPPTSIASVAALIAAGNLLDKLPPNAQSLDREAFAAALGVGREKTMKYWIGWRTVPDLENGGKTRRFGIFAIEEGDEELTEGSEDEENPAGEEEASIGEEASMGDEPAGGRSTASVGRLQWRHTL